MTALLRADLARMRTNKYFWLCVLVTFFASALFVYIMLMNGARVSWEGMMFGFSGVSLFTSGAFAALFLGEEYSSGAIRRKLIIGKKRTHVLFSNIITSVTGGLCMLAAEKAFPLLAALFGGAGKLTMETADFAWGILICVCAVIASCVLFAVIGTLISGTSTAVVLTLVLTIGACAAAPIIRSKLEIPQTITVADHEEPNPEAVTGGVRLVLENVCNTLSFGQLAQASRDTDARGSLPLYSLGTVIVTAAAGAIMFRGKDVK